MEKITISPGPLRKTKLKFGLIGLGKIMENAEIPAYKTAGYNLSCGADIDEASRRNARDNWGIANVYSDYKEMLDKEDIDILNVAVPAESAELRVEIMREAAERKMPVMMQKPMNVTMEHSKKMVEIAERAGIKFSVNHNSRWAPVFYGVKRIIEEGVIGVPENITVEGRVAAHSGEIIRNFCIHNYDIIRWWTNRIPRDIDAFLDMRENRKRFVTTVFRYDDGSLATCNDSTHIPDDFRWLVRVEGEDGVIFGSQKWSKEQGEDELYVRDGATGEKHNFQLSYHYVPEGFAYSMNDLVKAVEDDTVSAMSGRDSLITMDIVFRAMKSAGR